MGDTGYYKTVIQVTVLSDTPYQFINLVETGYDITGGDCTGTCEIISRATLTKEEMADACDEVGSDPAFFGIEEDEEYEGEDAEIVGCSVVATDGVYYYHLDCTKYAIPFAITGDKTPIQRGEALDKDIVCDRCDKNLALDPGGQP